MPGRTVPSILESASAAGRLLGAVRSGSRREIQAELQIAQQFCGQPFQGDTAEEERRELLGSVVDRLQQALLTGEVISAESRRLAGCVTLLEHLHIEMPHRSFAATCRHRSVPVCC